VGVGDGARLEQVEQLLLAIALGQRVQALARRPLVAGLGAQRGERGERFLPGARHPGDRVEPLALVGAQRRDGATRRLQGG
jgi:hypothetical protein